MTVMQIILLIIGIVVFIASFRITAGKEELTTEQRALVKEEIEKIVQESMKDATTQFAENMEETANYTVEKSERSMERLTNEKMMAISEYADTVISDIHKNHEEVVFLYDMLNDKQVNLKNTVHEVEQTAKTVKKQVEEVKSEFPNMDEQIAEVMQAKKKRSREKEKEFAPFVVPTIQVEKKEKGAVPEEAAIRLPNMPELLFNDAAEAEGEERNSNEAILALHKAGKSNMAIARELGLGVGEVKLVIDLFKGM